MRLKKQRNYFEMAVVVLVDPKEVLAPENLKKKLLYLT